MEIPKGKPILKPIWISPGKNLGNFVWKARDFTNFVGKKTCAKESCLHGESQKRESRFGLKKKGANHQRWRFAHQKLGTSMVILCKSNIILIIIMNINDMLGGFKQRKMGQLLTVDCNVAGDYDSCAQIFSSNRALAAPILLEANFWSVSDVDFNLDIKQVRGKIKCTLREG